MSGVNTGIPVARSDIELTDPDNRFISIGIAGTEAALNQYP